jgi:DNA-binding PadR family transcriptional regulator
MSGYDIKTRLNDLDWLIGGSSFGNIYPTLHALHDARLVSVEVVSSPDKPSKKVYHTTEEGRRRFGQWAQDLSEASGSLKSFVMSLLVAGSIPQEGLIAFLQQRRELIAAEHHGLEEAVCGGGKGSSDEIAFERRLAQDYGRAIAAAELAWLDDSLDRLS